MTDFLTYIGAFVFLWLAFGCFMLCTMEVRIPTAIPWSARITMGLHAFVVLPYVLIRYQRWPKGAAIMDIDPNVDDCPCPKCMARRKRDGVPY